jgi:hypothetical protein
MTHCLFPPSLTSILRLVLSRPCLPMSSPPHQSSIAPALVRDMERKRLLRCETWSERGKYGWIGMQRCPARFFSPRSQSHPSSSPLPSQSASVFPTARNIHGPCSGSCPRHGWISISTLRAELYTPYPTPPSCLPSPLSYRGCETSRT